MIQTRSDRSIRLAATRRTIALASAAALLMAACSGSESSDDTVAAPTTVETSDSTTTTEETTTTSTSTTTTVAETTTTLETIRVDEAETSDETTTTVESEPAPDPSIPVDTTFDPTTVEGEIEQVILADNEALKECLRTLPKCDVAAATRFGAIDYAEGQGESFEQLNRDDWRAEDADEISIVVTAVRFGDFETEAEVNACVVNPSQLVFPSEGEELQRFGDYVSALRQFVVAKIEGDWKITGSLTLESATGQENDLCVG